MDFEIVTILGALVGALTSVAAMFFRKRQQAQANLGLSGNLKITIRRADGTTTELTTSDPDLLREVEEKLQEAKSKSAQNHTGPATPLVG